MKQRFNLLLSALSVLLTGHGALAQDANPNASFKVPPLEVSSDFPYDHK